MAIIFSQASFATLIEFAIKGAKPDSAALVYEQSPIVA
jgi:hypothetical protein